MGVSSKGSAERRQAMVEYLKQMTDVVLEASDMDSRTAALDAILTEIKGKEGLIATDQRLSKVLERLITANSATVEILLPLFTAIQSALFDIVYDQYGSHFIETVLISLLSVDASYDTVSQVQLFVDSICSDLVGLIADARATFVVRTAAMGLSGFKKPDATAPQTTDLTEYLIKSLDSSESLASLETTNKLCGREDYLKGLVQILTTMSMMDEKDIFNLASGSPHSSVTFQVLLLLGARVEETKNIIKRVIQRVVFSATPSEESLSVNTDLMTRLLDSKIGSKFLETVFIICNKVGWISDISEPFVEQFVLKNEGVLATIDGEVDAVCRSGSRSAFFELKFGFGFLQAFISSLGDTQTPGSLPRQIKMFGKIIYCMFSSEGLRACVTSGRSNGLGLIQRLVEKCGTIREFAEFQKPLFDNILFSLGITGTDKYVYVWKLLLELSPASFANREGTYTSSAIDSGAVTATGSLLVSTLMGYKQFVVQPLISNADCLINHLVELSGEQFLNSKWMKEISAGRCLQTIISLKSTLPTGIKKKLIKALFLSGRWDVDVLSAIANDKRVGAWLVTTAWDTCSGDVQTKQALGDALVGIPGLRESNWKVWRYCGLATFSRNNTEWTAVEKQKAKARNHFADIIGSAPQETKKPRL